MGAQTFKARLQSVGPGGAWMRMNLPFSAEKVFGARGRTSVVVELGGTRFNTSIFPNGDGRHHMMVNKAMQKAAGAGDGDTVAVTMRTDDGKGAVALPKELSAALKSDKKAKAAFDALSPSCRREYASWVGGAKQEVTRVSRAEKAMTMVAAGKKRPSD